MRSLVIASLPDVAPNVTFGEIKNDVGFILGQYIMPSINPRSLKFSGLPDPIIDPETRKPFANKQIPSQRFSPAAQFFLDPKWVPLPNGPGRQLKFPGQKRGPNRESVHG